MPLLGPRHSALTRVLVETDGRSDGPWNAVPSSTPYCTRLDLGPRLGLCKKRTPSPALSLSLGSLSPFSISSGLGRVCLQGNVHSLIHVHAHTHTLCAYNCYARLIRTSWTRRPAQRHTTALPLPLGIATRPPRPPPSDPPPSPSCCHPSSCCRRRQDCQDFPMRLQDARADPSRLPRPRLVSATMTT